MLGNVLTKTRILGSVVGTPEHPQQQGRMLTLKCRSLMIEAVEEYRRHLTSMREFVNMKGGTMKVNGEIDGHWM